MILLIFINVITFIIFELNIIKKNKKNNDELFSNFKNTPLLNINESTHINKYIKKLNNINTPSKLNLSILDYLELEDYKDNKDNNNDSYKDDSYEDDNYFTNNNILNL